MSASLGEGDWARLEESVRPTFLLLFFRRVGPANFSLASFTRKNAKNAKLKR